MEFHGTRSKPISLTQAVPWNSMELWVRQFRWLEQFHGIPWNSIELRVRQFRWHEQFHGIPWNLKCANFADTISSMEFHGIPWNWSAPISLKREVPWNSMELRMRQFRWHEQFHGIPWNSMELRVRQFRWHEQFHGIPWNSMELEVRQFRWHEKFHGIPWNLECANFADMSSSMEFHGIPRNLECANFADTRSSMEFHGTWSAPISLTREVPWNSMELGVRQFRWQEQFHGIPWNLKYANFNDTTSSMEFHGTTSAPISLTQAVPWNYIELGLRQFRLQE